MMFFSESRVRIWLCTEPTDMRKSFQGLAALTKTQLKEDPTSGHLFAFLNKRKNYMKVLYFDRTGYCLWAKKLEAGHFHYQSTADGKRELDMTQFKLMLEGLVEKDFKKMKRYVKN